MAYLMKCGHTSNAVKQVGEDKYIPVCVICDCDEVVNAMKGTEGLEGRKARCTEHKMGHGSGFTDSRWDLPFFKYCPDKQYDEYYCGCWGWD